MLGSAVEKLQITGIRMMTSSVKETKAAFRKRFRTALGDLDSQEIEDQSKLIARRCLELPEYREATSISVFLSMPGREISTRDIVVQALEDGKRVFVPYIYSPKDSSSKIMDMLRIKDKNDLASLQPDSWGIPSLSADTVGKRENALGGFGCWEDIEDSSRAVSTLDLIFMPAMAFDREHHRLGHGKGFYDRYLTRYQNLARSKQMARDVPHLVGLALKEQLLPPGEELPTTDSDWKVDRIVSVDT